MSSLSFPGKNFRVAIFASGTGSNAAKLIEHFKDHPFIHIALIVCNKPGAGVLQVADSYNIHVLMVERERFCHGDGYVQELQAAAINFIVLAGFLWKIPPALIHIYNRKIINIHPALLPKYGGKGMYGSKVHEAVIAAGEIESGITIHYVDEHYDNGDIIVQQKCSIETDDTPDTLAAKVHQLEYAYFAATIEELLSRPLNLEKKFT